MKKRILILSNVALAGLLTVMGCSKKVVTDPIVKPEEPIQKAEPDLPPLLYGPPPVQFDGQKPQDTTQKRRVQREPRKINDDRDRVKPLYGVPPAEFQIIEEKK